MLAGPWGLTLLGFLGGMVLGLAARLGGFCTLGVIEDALYARRFAKLGMWLWAWALAIGLVAIAKSGGLIDLQTSLYAMTPTSLTALIFGGLIFGYGMALAGTCGFTALARFGSGDLRAFLILIVIGVSAYISIAGPMAYARLLISGAEPLPIWLDDELAAVFDISSLQIGLAIAAIAATSALLIKGFRQDKRAVFWSSAVSLSIASAWIGTSLISNHGFESNAVQSHSFSAPIGKSLLYLMTSTGSSIGFAIGSVLGVIIGSSIGSLSQGHFNWEACDDPRELGRQMLGAFLMGTGAVWALGCSIGEGLSGMAVLSGTAPIVLASIVIGAMIGLKQLLHGFSWSSA